MKAGEAPFEYAMMKYRQYFGLSWNQFINETPPEVYFTDMEMISIETEVNNAHQKKVPTQ